MIINHNITSLNTLNKLSANNNAVSKSLEKLSSGLRINKAGDDAAGLAISEKMRGQIRGLDQASANSQDGISLIQTAEGALNETTSILQRMRELAVQSATDTNTNDDRAKIQSETDQLAKEITRISNTTEFNTQTLVNGAVKSGSAGEMKFQIGANAAQNVSLSINAMDAKSLGVTRDAQAAALSSNGTMITGASMTTGSSVPTGTVTVTAADVADSAATKTWTTTGGGTVAITAAAGQGTAANALQFVFTASAGASPTAAQAGNVVTVSLGTTASNNDTTNLQAAIRGLSSVAGVDVSNWTVASAGTVSGSAVVANMAGGVDAGINVTATNGTSETVKVATNATSVNFTGNMKGLTLTKNSAATAAAAMGTTTLAVTNDASSAATFSAGVLSAAANAAGGINVSTQSAADAAITTINTAITTVSAERSKLGAMQNRLEHTINNLTTSSENISAAESRVRDVNMAKEMTNFQKNSILSQAATAMLAQANQQPQSVLQLLK